MKLSNRVLKVILLIILVENISDIYNLISQKNPHHIVTYILLLIFRALMILFSLYFIVKGKET